MVPIYYAFEYFSSEQKISLFIKVFRHNGRPYSDCFLLSLLLFFIQIFFFCLLVYLNNNPLTLAVSGKMCQGYFFIDILLYDISRVPDLLLHSLINK